jgi:hypothetical protein
MVILHHHPEHWLMPSLTKITATTADINPQDLDRRSPLTIYTVPFAQDQFHWQLSTSLQCGENILK